MEAPEPTEIDVESAAPGAEGNLYVVATVHLDTQWRWTIQRTIEEYLPATLDGNFALFEKYPHYTLSWEGAFRYMLIREYYPEAWERLREYVARGRWTVAGNMLESVDVHLASPESLYRQFLYGQRFFERELDANACDVFLPDCFGFGWSFPTIAAHCGLTGFSSQKLIKWVGPGEAPFDVGIWEGPDGGELIAALDPEGYGDGIEEDLSRAARWRQRVRDLGESTGLRVGYKYFGIGDRGGAPDEASIEWLSRSLEEPGPLRIVHDRSDRFFREVEAAGTDRLPRHRGELLLPEHGPGCYTSLASMKRWNRRNEQLAEAAERAACGATWQAGVPYPAAALEQGWLRFLWHQMHDDLTGTSIPQAYNFSWNDEALAENRFRSVLTDSVAAIAERLDTSADGLPLVVFNALSIDREDPVEAELRFGEHPPAAVRVFDAEGEEVPSQCTRLPGGRMRIVFLASVRGLGFAVFDVRPADAPCHLPRQLHVRHDSLENERYRLEIGKRGDLVHIHDKSLGVDLLTEPLELQLLPDRSSKFPAWEMHYSDVMATPRPMRRRLGCRIVETGAARVALEVRRAARGSTLVQTIRLHAGGAGNRIEIDNRLEWRTWGRMLKASFPFGDATSQSTYDLGLGAIERGVNREASYEVPAQQWADLSVAGGARGVSILTDCKYGWDRPRDEALRLTLVRSPWAAKGHAHQMTQDWALHRFTYALYSHADDWRNGTVEEAARLNQPLRAFQVDRRDRERPRRLSLASLTHDQVAIRALKRSEDGKSWIVRLQELAGEEQKKVRLALDRPIETAEETDGVERIQSKAKLKKGKLVTRLGAFQPRTFALRLDTDEAAAKTPAAQPVRLAFDTRGTSLDGESGADLDGRGHSLPAELFPESIDDGGVPFELGPGDAPNCMTCRGQQVPLPEGNWRSVLILAAALERVDVEFRVNGETRPLQVGAYRGPIGHASHRRAFGRVHWGPIRPETLVADRVAFVATHLHDREGTNLPYEFAYLYRYEIAMRRRSDAALSVLQLPDEAGVRLFAVTVRKATTARATPVWPDERFDGSAPSSRRRG